MKNHNLNLLANFAHNHIDKKSTKVQAYNALKNLVESLDYLDDDSEKLANLSVLYAFFSDSTNTKYKKGCPISFVKCVLSDKYEIRKQLQYVYCENDKLIATNGHILMITDNTKDLQNGYYDINGVNIELDIRYPDYNSVMLDLTSDQYVNISDMEVTIKNDKKNEYVELKCGNDIVNVNLGYYKIIKSRFTNEATIYLSSCTGKVQIKEGNNLCVLMGIL